MLVSPEFSMTLCDMQKAPSQFGQGERLKLIQLFHIATPAVNFFSNKPALNFCARCQLPSAKRVGVEFARCLMADNGKSTLVLSTLNGHPGAKHPGLLCKNRHV
jgi:hypothetical protein